MKKRITKRSVNAAKPAEKTYVVWDQDLTGFGLKVTPSSSKIYVLQYRAPGKGRSANATRITIGRHGDLTPDQARDVAAKMLLTVKQGGDPKKGRRPVLGRTVADLAQKFLYEYLPNKKRPPRQKTLDDYERLFRCHVIPRFGRKAVDEVTTEDFEALHNGMKKTPFQANRVLVVSQQAFDQAERWGWRGTHTNPVKGIERYREHRRGAKKEVMLTAAQMKRLLEAIEEGRVSGLDLVACDAIRFAFWTGWRISEVLKFEWKNVDLEIGRAKLVQTKTADEEYRQLPNEAVEMMKGFVRIVGNPYVFPGRRLGTHMTTVKGPWEHIRKRAGLDNLEGLGAFRLHDLRHNVVSWDVSRGVPLEIAGRNIGHRSRDATEIYAHFAPDALKKAADERADAMRTAVEEAESGADAPAPLAFWATNKGKRE